MIEINLLPWREELKNKRRLWQGASILLAALFSLCLILGLHFAAATQLKIVKARMSQTQDSLAQVNRRLEEARALYQNWDDRKRSELDLSAIVNHQWWILEFLKQLSAFMPRTLSARQIHFDERSWSIEGEALMAADILRFAERVKKNFKTEPDQRLLGKEKQLKIYQKNGFLGYQLRFESDL